MCNEIGNHLLPGSLERRSIWAAGRGAEGPQELVSGPWISSIRPVAVHVDCRTSKRSKTNRKYTQKERGRGGGKAGGGGGREGGVTVDYLVSKLETKQTRNQSSTWMHPTPSLLNKDLVIIFYCPLRHFVC